LSFRPDDAEYGTQHNLHRGNQRSRYKNITFTKYYDFFIRKDINKFDYRSTAIVYITKEPRIPY